MALTNRLRVARSAGGLLREGQLFDRNHYLVESLPAIAGQGTCTIAEHVDAGQLNRQRGEVSEVQLVEEPGATIRHHGLGRGTGDDVNRKAGVGLSQATERNERGQDDTDE